MYSLALVFSSWFSFYWICALCSGVSQIIDHADQLVYWHHHEKVQGWGGIETVSTFYSTCLGLVYTWKARGSQTPWLGDLCQQGDSSRFRWHFSVWPSPGWIQFLEEVVVLTVLKLSLFFDSLSYFLESCFFLPVCSVYGPMGLVITSPYILGVVILCPLDPVTSIHVPPVLVTQSCPTLCDPMDCSLPDSSIHGIFQVRVLKWVAISFSKSTTNRGA